MPPGSGLATTLGFGVEAPGSYGVYAPPTRWYEIESETLTANFVNAEGSGLAGGTLVDRGARRVRVSQAAAGTIVLYATQKAIGLLLAHLASSVAVPTAVPAAAGAFTATHADDNTGLRGRSLTIQKAIATTDGTIRPFSFTGCKVTALQIECGKGELVKLTLTVDARQVTESQAYVVPTYISGLIPFGFAGAALSFGAFGAEAAAAGITKLTLNIVRPCKIDSYYYNNAGLKAEPVQNGKTAITGTFETEWVDKTLFADRYAANLPGSLVVAYSGPLIVGTTFASLGIAVPQLFIENDTPVAAGPDVISPHFTFKGTYDDTHAPFALTYVSADAAL